MKILYILGRGRSGSTILANVLGEIPGFFSAGELRAFWDPVMTRRSDCACGAPIDGCELWAPVLDALGEIDVQRYAAWQREVVKESNLRRLLSEKGRGGWRALESYAEVTRRLYDAIGRVTGCRVIVDSSKRPSYAAFLRLVDGLDTHVVHLSRDPRASAHSWQARRYESAQGGEVRRRNALDATLRWDLLNLSSEALLKGMPNDRKMRLRYEDFVAAPRGTVTSICKLLDETSDALPFVDERTVTLGPNHTIAGNPSRLRTGALEIRDSADWKRDQSRLARWTATVVALPFLKRYGYSLRV